MASLLGRILQLALLWLVATVAAVASQALPPNCSEKCGNVDIPYPFGIESGCYLNNDFRINCSESSGSRRAYLTEGNIEVTNISLEGELEILQDVARDCYKDGLPVDHKLLQFPLFSISRAKNKLTAVGCDTDATFSGISGNKTYYTGCKSYCNTRPPTDNLVNNGYCSGIGYCEISIPSGLTNISVSLRSFYNYTKVKDFNPCGYAFVADKSKFNASFKSFDELKNRTDFPLVLDWTIANKSCTNSENKTDYACMQNSDCYDPGIKGYRCKCKEGYKGNPYLQNQNGCQDKNECEDGSHNCIDEKHCNNIEGSFNCSCPKGYHGDGTKNGTGCTAEGAEANKFSIGIGVSALVLLVGVSWSFGVYHKRKLLKLTRKLFFEQNGGKMLRQELNERQLSGETALILSEEQLKEATNNYDESQIMRKGGFGTVYKGTLKNGREVAIKKPKSFDQSQVKTFIDEFISLSQISHENVAKLLGCCLEREVPLLVYEFVPNGTLYDHIHGKNGASALSWGVRLRVAAETAKAVASLHSATPPIIHRDVKPQNILLDDNLTAKVSDFGASRLVPVDQTQLSTMVQGAFGYLDPEYFHTGKFTEKSDVYSFGVVLVELLTSKKAIAYDRPENERSLVNLFLSTLEDDGGHHSLFQILDDLVAKDGSIEQIKEVAELAKRCLRVKGEERPRMEEVAMELEGLRVMGKHPWVGTEVNSEETQQFQILDGQVAEDGDTEHIENVAELAKKCRNVQRKGRPRMEETAKDLEGLSVMGEPPWVGVEANSEETQQFQILDGQVAEDIGDTEQIKNVAELAKKCRNVQRKGRPRMEETAKDLEGLRVMGEPPWVGVEANSEETQQFQILDGQVAEDIGDTEQIKNVAELAKKCRNVQRKERPRMEETAKDLEGLRVMGEPPWVGVEANSEETQQFQILDGQVAEDIGDTEQIKNVAELAKKCRNVQRKERPRMEETAKDLEGLRVMGEPPWVGVEVNSEETQQFQILDGQVAEDGDTEQIKNVAGLAKKYRNVRREERPRMEETAKDLEGLRAMGEPSSAGVEAKSEEIEHFTGQLISTASKFVGNIF